MIEEQDVFVDNPFDMFRYVLPFVVVIYIIAALVIMSIGVPPQRKGMQLGTGGFLVMLFFCFSAVLAIVWVTCSFWKKRTIVCGREGCEIYAEDYWGSTTAPVTFLWREVTDMSLEENYIGRGVSELSLNIRIFETIHKLMIYKTFARHDFERIVEIVNRSTSHLKHEIVKSDLIAGRNVLMSTRQFAKVDRAAGW